MIKKFVATILIFVSTVSGIVALAPPVQAAFDGVFNDACQGVSDSTVCQDKAQGQSTDSNFIYGKNGIITKIINLLSIVIGVAAVIMIIIAGIRFVVSGGDATKVATAKSTILYAIGGLVVAALAQAMIAFVLNRL